MSDVIASTVIGAISGIAEVTVNQPLIFVKNALQTGAPLSANPLVLYRGYTVNVSSLAPITALQVAASGVIYNAVFNKGPNHSATLFEMGASAMGAGSLSGLLSGPSESIILQQQATGRGALETLKVMSAQAGLKSIFRGTPLAMLRDGGFTAGFMALGPFLTSSLNEHGQSELASRLLGGIGAGVIAAIVTHPFDTLKTRYQKDFMKKQYPSFSSAVRAGGLFKGLSARGMRVIVGTVIISNVTDLLNKQYAQYKTQHTQKLDL